jgi:hypothetical protein
VLVHASHNAALFARGEGLALEAVDAGIEALLDEVRVHLGDISAMSLRFIVALFSGRESGTRLVSNIQTSAPIAYESIFSMWEC